MAVVPPARRPAKVRHSGSTNEVAPLTKPQRLLEVDGLAVEFSTDEGPVRAVHEISFHIDRGETVAIVGESGSGKSVTSLAIMGLLPRPAGKVVAGSIRLQGRDGRFRDVTKLDEASLRKIRGNEVAMIFQEPMTSLNPVFSVGDQIAEAIMIHQGKSRRSALKAAEEMLDLVGIPDPRRRLSTYPHELSGGMRQRVMIAMALSCGPSLLIADEPTTALDVTIQAQILDLIRRLQKELGMAVLFITHDLGVVAEIADRVLVMYAGRVVEEAQVTAALTDPLHPYTMGLLRSIPQLDMDDGPRRRIRPIPGTMPNPASPPPGCAFHPRCSFCVPGRCDLVTVPPVLEQAANGRRVRCVRWAEIRSEPRHAVC